MVNCTYWCKKCHRKKVSCFKTGKFPVWLCDACGFEFRGSKKEVRSWDLI